MTNITGVKVRFSRTRQAAQFEPAQAEVELSASIDEGNADANPNAAAQTAAALALVAAGAFARMGTPQPQLVQPPAEFFAGKTLRIIVPFDIAGTYITYYNGLLCECCIGIHIIDTCNYLGNSKRKRSINLQCALRIRCIDTNRLTVGVYRLWIFTPCRIGNR